MGGIESSGGDHGRVHRRERRNGHEDDAAGSGSRYGAREDADLGTEMARIARDLAQGFGAGAKQQIVDEPLFCEGKGASRWRQGEDDMDIGRWATVAARAASQRSRAVV